MGAIPCGCNSTVFSYQGAGPNKVSNEFMVLTFDNFCTYLEFSTCPHKFK